jgi:peptide chain release factor 1
MDKNFDIRITRGHGPGGQHKNKVETCVIITHVPTGLQEMCQDSRSKNRNLKIAKERLDKKIIKYQDKQIQEIKNEKRKELIKNQSIIRTYNYNENRVYDHRTKIRYDLKKFMKGEIDL